MENQKANYRIYDMTGGGVTEDIYAESLEDAIKQGREWIEAGDWGDDCDGETLHCEVYEIVRDEDGDVNNSATRRGEMHDCSGTAPAAKPPECKDGTVHSWRAPHDLVGGCKENPGVFGSGHGTVSITHVCSRCGIYWKVDYGATDSDGRKTTKTTYTDADEASLAWVESLN